jgi:hypothetical protein
MTLDTSLDATGPGLLDGRLPLRIARIPKE